MGRTIINFDVCLRSDLPLLFVHDASFFHPPRILSFLAFCLIELLLVTKISIIINWRNRPCIYMYIRIYRYTAGRLYKNAQVTFMAYPDSMNHP